MQHSIIQIPRGRAWHAIRALHFPYGSGHVSPKCFEELFRDIERVAVKLAPLKNCMWIRYGYLVDRANLKLSYYVRDRECASDAIAFTSLQTAALSSEERVWSEGGCFNASAAVRRRPASSVRSCPDLNNGGCHCSIGLMQSEQAARRFPQSE